MKRVGYLFEQVADFGALCAAARRAARGKGETPSAASFTFHMETEVLKLQRELLDGSYRPRPYRTFTVSDPKPRTISAAEFRDRVAHHALCAVLEPLFERAAIFDSYACRPGKGSHAAIRRAQAFARRFGYFLKLDVRKFFENADHGVIKRSLGRLVKDKRLLALADVIIDHGAPGSAPGKGLPIGNLTSQHFANHYLSSLDHFIKEGLRVRGYVRYMDDQLLFSDSKDSLRDAHRRIRAFVEGELKLDLKSEATILAPVSEGVPFLGLRLWPGVVRLDGPAKRRLIRSLRMGAQGLASGRLDENDLAASLRSRLGHAAHADTLGLRRSLGDLMDLGSEAIRARTG
ncbi:MAG: RNA-dependent DNA polymerase [Elusimicrobia bacterium]|nr:RNA-dependent DNA polymerase [Elusimicrobiota bacterium]